MSKKIVVVGDMQLREGVPYKYVAGYAQYIVDQRPNHVVILGDWWDMPSLSIYNSILEQEGLRVVADLEAGWKAMELFMGVINKGRKRYRSWKPTIHFTVGNHDPQVRIPRFLEKYPALQGLLPNDTSKRLRKLGIRVYEFLEVCKIADIRFSHYFINPYSAKGAPLSGNIETMIKNVGFSFVMGHNQKGRMGRVFLPDGTPRIGLVNGASYGHLETYLGPQGNHHWRGIVQLNDAHKGNADILEISLKYIKKKYKV